MVSESATEVFRSGSPDEEAETQLRIWVLLDDRSDNVGRDMRE